MSKKIVSAFSIASVSTIAAMGVSVLTNKLISTVGGVESMGVMGAFRSLGAVMAGFFALGYPTLFNRRFALTLSDNESLWKSVAGVVFFQMALAVIFSLLLAPILNRFLFGENAVGVVVVGLVIFVSLVNSLLQSFQGVLRGLGEIKRLAILQITIAIGSLLLILPLLKMGTMGLALNVASGSLLGLLVSGWWLHGKGLRIFPGILKSGLETIKADRRECLFLVLQVVSVFGGVLALQSQISRSEGFHYLGLFGSCYLLVDSAVLVLTSSTWSHLVPELAKSQTDEQRAWFYVRFCQFLLVVGTITVLFLSLFSKELLQVLFSKDFVEGVPVLRWMALGILGQMLIYAYNAYLVYRGYIRTYVALDAFGMILVNLFAAIALAKNYSILGVAFCYGVVCLISATAYFGLTRWREGAKFCPVSIPLLAYGLFGFLAFLQYWETGYPLPLRVLVFGVLAVGVFFLIWGSETWKFIKRGGFRAA